MLHASLSSDVIRDLLPCARDEHPSGDCSELLARVRQVRDELVRQEQHIAERRRRLDTYLAEGYQARPGRPQPTRTGTVPKADENSRAVHSRRCPPDRFVSSAGARGSDLLLELQGFVPAPRHVLVGADDQGLRVDVEVDRLTVYLREEDEIALVRS